MTRVIVHLNEREWAALRALAARDLRGLREQARWLIVRGLAAESVADFSRPTQTETEVALPEAGHAKTSE